MYVDDLVLLADSPEDLQELLYIREEVCICFKLQLSQSKCSVLSWENRNQQNYQLVEKLWTLQRRTLDSCDTVKYLEVNIYAGSNYTRR